MKEETDTGAVEPPVQQNVEQTNNEQTEQEEEYVLPKPEFKISGIVWNSERPQAIIEGRVLEVGDKIEDWSISNIDQRGVEIIYLDYKYILTP